MKREELKSIFDALRNDPAHHLGLGDIRLTIAQQDEILAMVSPLPPAEGAEAIKQALCDDIEKSLNSAKMKHILSEDGEAYPFVDFMSTGDTIAEGREEIENIVEQIYFDMDSWPSLATLHAQQIAEKMVRERLREELIKLLRDKTVRDTYGIIGIEDIVDEYLKTREK